MSVCTRGPYGEVLPTFTASNYARLAGFGQLGFNPIHVKIFGRTIVVAACTTALCVALSAPFVFWTARLSPRWRPLVLLLVTIPFWTNLLVRTYAWQILLSPRSLLAAAARTAGLIGPEDGLYPGYAATLLALAFDYLPFMVLPLYTSVERIDWRIWEAAIDLGARPYSAFRHGVLPQIKPGLFAGAVLVFVPVLGQFVSGNTIAQQFGPSRDWPFGAALASAQIAAALVLLRFLKRFESEGS
jgi:spermidine/putrescine transport system permease protein